MGLISRVSSRTYRNSNMAPHKSLKIKKVLAKAQKQNRPLPQWFLQNRKQDPLQRQAPTLEANQAWLVNREFACGYYAVLLLSPSAEVAAVSFSNKVKFVN